MQLQFQKTLLPCLRRGKGEVQSQEETQELRLTEDMPDIGSVLGAWGQVLLRGKEWRSGRMELSCGVMAWAMYLPEQGGAPQIAEAWIPFQFKWDLPDTEEDGTIRASCLLRGVEARSTSSRKLMLRATMEVLGEAWMPEEWEVSIPESVPEDVFLLKNTHLIWLPREAGEKPFALDEELTLPASAPGMEKLLRFSLQPELTDKKIMADKAVFRGTGLLHILYQSPEGALCSWDFELPFSQYAELEHSYGQDAESSVCLGVTALELDKGSEGRLHLKAGLTGQYLVCERTDLEVVEDAYSPGREVVVRKEILELPAVLEQKLTTVHVEQPLAGEVGRVVDVAFYPQQPSRDRSEDHPQLRLGGQFQALYHNKEGGLQCASTKWEKACPLTAEGDCQLQMLVYPSGIPQAAMGGELLLKGDALLDVRSVCADPVSMVTAIDVNEVAEPDPNRPSLILRRSGNDTLWEIAKAAGSTVEAIREANRLQEEPGPEQMLIVPVR